MSPPGRHAGRVAAIARRVCPRTAGCSTTPRPGAVLRAWGWRVFRAHSRATRRTKEVVPGDLANPHAACRAVPFHAGLGRGARPGRLPGHGRAWLGGGDRA